MFDLFGLSSQIKYSALIGASALLLFGIGYVIGNTTNLIDEITEEKEISTEEVIESVGGASDVSTGDIIIGLTN